MISKPRPAQVSRKAFSFLFCSSDRPTSCCETNLGFSNGSRRVIEALSLLPFCLFLADAGFGLGVAEGEDEEPNPRPAGLGFLGCGVGMDELSLVGGAVFGDCAEGSWDLTERHETRASAEESTNPGTALLWFKHDLRIDDHPGLVAAARYRALVPFYVFDHRILSRFKDEELELLLYAVKDLRQSLKDQGSDLVIRCGSAERVIRELVQEVNAASIFAEEELEYDLCKVVDSVKETITTVSYEYENPRILLWHTPFYDIKSLKDLPVTHQEFKKLKCSVLPPLLLPKLPNIKIDVALGKFLRIHEKLRNAESREGASFGTLFGSALHLGILSRRRVFYEAIKYEKERNAGFLSPFGYSAATVAAAADTVRSMEVWYRLMSLRSQMSDEGTYSIRIWRWNGYLYSVAGQKGPAVLLVHGFGAFLEHYRGNINGICEGGNRVWVITLLGFGRSEKPNVIYTELMWAELLRDFIIEVVGEPAHLVGNSFGGYFVAIVAGLWPALAKSVVLLNSAGNVVPGYSSVLSPGERRTSGAAWFGARLLLTYLRLGLRNIVKNCYPVKPDRADDWLINEMLRASYDPGVVVVLESIFSFNLSLPLNYLLEGLEGKVLVIQGMKDPISDSKSKLAMLREECKGVVIKELDAGHCPHDEQPEQVNSIIREWVVNWE
ncbi:hypothetical protein RJ639_027825 [Escallonia herrerae]|uniref:Photolyase/cryptochrome alpha/beta domain-containing protein n=1 Tax=Escallonia herrerae TaxID=1293975 RepID=A0AA88X7P8_9ASTE|nr:hypothetical protein RJ639_027825 [Escallonia herrerae]